MGCWQRMDGRSRSRAWRALTALSLGAILMSGDTVAPSLQERSGELLGAGAMVGRATADSVTLTFHAGYEPVHARLRLRARGSQEQSAWLPLQLRPGPALP